MRIGETHPLRCNAIDIRCGHLGVIGVVAVDVAEAQVIGEDDDDIGAILSGPIGGLARHAGEEDAGKEATDP
jgi:hypothetical protein